MFVIRLLISLKRWFQGQCQVCGTTKIDWRGADACPYHDLIPGFIKPMSIAINDSTCQKRVTVCEIVSQGGYVIVRESNRCNPCGGRCHRIGVQQNKHNYDIDSHCNWTHAEINAIEAYHK